MNRRDEEYRDKLRELFQSAMPEDVQAHLLKKAMALADDFSDRIEWWLKDDLADILMGYVQDMADRAVESLLKGNEDMLRRYLTCEKHGYTGRDRDHPVIHGRLFETGGLQVRKEIVDAHAELLKNERILDLEDQVRSLVEQVNKKDSDLERLRERLRDYA